MTESRWTHKFDQALVRTLAGVHRFLAWTGFYPVALSTLLCAGLFGVRAYLSRSWTFYFLLWNLFLAWVPYLSSLWAARLHQKHPRAWWWLLMPGAIGLAFFPNAPYIVTDFFHLTERWPIPLWYDIGLLACFAWTGIVLGVYALRVYQDLVAVRVGRILSWVFALVVLGFSGMGVYMGRFLRWNSWDLVVQPRAVLSDVAVRLRNPIGNMGTLGVTLMFASLMLVCYLALTAGPTVRRLLETDTMTMES
jgi:uncharacterized membrane protein